MTTIVTLLIIIAVLIVICMGVLFWLLYKLSKVFEDDGTDSYLVDELKQSAETSSKFNVGDPVKIVNYGNIYWESKKSGMGMHLHYPVINEDEDTYYVDTNPELVGKLAIIDKYELVQGKHRYGLMLTDSNNHMAWFNEGQLELNIAQK
jgi:hypothetical protein